MMTQAAQQHSAHRAASAASCAASASARPTPHLAWSWCGFYFAYTFFAAGNPDALHAMAEMTA